MPGIARLLLVLACAAVFARCPIRRARPSRNGIPYAHIPSRSDPKPATGGGVSRDREQFRGQGDPAPNAGTEHQDRPSHDVGGGRRRSRPADRRGRGPVAAADAEHACAVLAKNALWRRRQYGSQEATDRSDRAIADVDQRRYAHSIPDDPLFVPTAGASGQWFMQTPSAAIINVGGTATQDLSATDAVSAWAITTGSAGT